MKFLENYADLKEPLYITVERVRDIDSFPKEYSLIAQNKWQTDTVENILEQIFHQIEKSEIKSLHRKIRVEPITRPPQEIYEEYQQNEEGDWEGVGKPKGYTKPQIGVFVQLLGSKFD